MKKSKTFEWNKVTPLSKYLAMALFVALPFIGFVIGVKYEILLSPNARQCAQIRSSSIDTRESGSLPGWVIYRDSQNRFSFEYPEEWYYDGSMLYSISQSKFAEINSKTVINNNDYLKASLLFINQKLSDYISIKYQNDSYYKYRVNSTKHTYFGKTDVVTYIFCNSGEVFEKGAVIKPGGSCIEESYIDFGNIGYIKINLSDTMYNCKLESEIELFKSVLSTFNIHQ